MAEGLARRACQHGCHPSACHRRLERLDSLGSWIGSDPVELRPPGLGAPA